MEGGGREVNWGQCLAPPPDAGQCLYIASRRLKRFVRGSGSKGTIPPSCAAPAGRALRQRTRCAICYKQYYNGSFSYVGLSQKTKQGAPWQPKGDPNRGPMGALYRGPVEAL